MLKPTLKTKRFWSILIASIMVVVILSASSLYAATLSFNTVGMEGSQVSGATWIFFRSGSTYYARNGLSGEVTSNTAIHTLVQNIANTMTTGGKLFFTKGTYEFTDGITIPYGGIYIEGEGMGIFGKSTVLSLMTAGVSSNYRALINFTSSTQQYFGGVSNLEIVGNSLAYTVGIVIDGHQNFQSDITISKVMEFQFSFGVWLDALNYKLWNIWIRDSLLEGNEYVGIYFKNAPFNGVDWNATYIDRVHITGNHFYGNGQAGIWIDVTADLTYHVEITDNTFEQEEISAIRMYNGRGVNINNNKIFDCGTSGPNYWQAVYLMGENDYTEIINVKMEGNRIGNHFTNNNQKYGIYIDAAKYGGVDGVRLVANIMEGNEIPLYIGENVTDIQYGFNQGFVDGTGIEPYDYEIFKGNATHYFAKNGTTGNIDYSSTNASYVWNSADDAITAAGGGTMHVKAGTYTFTAGFLQGKKTRLVGDGSRITWMVQSTNNFDMITIDSANTESDWAIIGIGIEVNYVNGNGIYSAHASYTNNNDGTPRIQDLRVEEIKSGYSGVWLQDTFQMVFSNIQIRANKGTGMKFTVDETKGVHFGNCYFEEILIGINDVNAIGLEIVGGTTYRAMNLAQFNRLQIGGSATSYDGTIGIKITKDRYITFYSVDLEGCATQVYLDDAAFIAFFNPFIWSEYNTASYYGISLVDNTYGCNFLGGLIQTASNGRAYWDASASSSVPRNFVGGAIVIYGQKQYTWTVLGEGAYVSGPTRVWGTATITSGTSYVIVSHGLASTPTIVIVTGRHAETADAYVSARAWNTFTITVINNVTADRIVDYYAAYQP